MFLDITSANGFRLRSPELMRTFRSNSRASGTASEPDPLSGCLARLRILPRWVLCRVGPPSTTTARPVQWCSLICVHLPSASLQESSYSSEVTCLVRTITRSGTVARAGVLSITSLAQSTAVRTAGVHGQRALMIDTRL